MPASGWKPEASARDSSARCSGSRLTESLLAQSLADASGFLVRSALICGDFDRECALSGRFRLGCAATPGFEIAPRCGAGEPNRGCVRPFADDSGKPHRSFAGGLFGFGTGRDVLGPGGRSRACSSSCSSRSRVHQLSRLSMAAAAARRLGGSRPTAGTPAPATRTAALGDCSPFPGDRTRGVFLLAAVLSQLGDRLRALLARVNASGA